MTATPMRGLVMVFGLWLSGCGAEQVSVPLPSDDVLQPTSTRAALETFTENLHPRPLSPTAYRLNFASSQRWVELLYGTQRVGGALRPLAVEAGKPLFVHYARGPLDIGGEGELRQVELFYRLDDGPVQTALVARSAQGALTVDVLSRTPVSVNLPAEATGGLELWFKQTLADGRELWDSDFGRNHLVDVLPSAGTILRFDDQWNQAASGPLRAGTSLRLAYDVDRVFPLLRGTNHHGGLTWGVIAFVSFDGKAASEHPLTANYWPEPGGSSSSSTAEVRSIEAVLEIPADAQDVSVWFRGWAYGNEVWDSAFGANYAFRIVSPQ